MRKLMVVVALVGSALASYAQGYIVFNEAVGSGWYAELGVAVGGDTLPAGSTVQTPFEIGSGMSWAALGPDWWNALNASGTMISMMVYDGSGAQVGGMLWLEPMGGNAHVFGLGADGPYIIESMTGFVPPVVPEPGAASFFLLGLALMAWRLRVQSMRSSPGISIQPSCGLSARVPSC